MKFVWQETGYRITHSDLDEAKEELTAKRHIPKAIKHSLKFLRHVLNDTVLTGKLEKSPFAIVNMPKVPQGCARFLTFEEEAALYEGVPLLKKFHVGLPESNPGAIWILTTSMGESFSQAWRSPNFVGCSSTPCDTLWRPAGYG